MLSRTTSAAAGSAHNRTKSPLRTFSAMSASMLNAGVMRRTPPRGTRLRFTPTAPPPQVRVAPVDPEVIRLPAPPTPPDAAAHHNLRGTGQCVQPVPQRVAQPGDDVVHRLPPVFEFGVRAGARGCAPARGRVR